MNVESQKIDNNKIFKFLFNLYNIKELNKINKS